MIFAVLDVSLDVNLCINCSFLHLYPYNNADELYLHVNVYSTHDDRMPNDRDNCPVAFIRYARVLARAFVTGRGLAVITCIVHEVMF